MQANRPGVPNGHLSAAIGGGGLREEVGGRQHYTSQEIAHDAH